MQDCAGVVKRVRSPAFDGALRYATIRTFEDAHVYQLLPESQGHNVFTGLLRADDGRSSGATLPRRLVVAMAGSAGGPYLFQG